MEIIDDEILQQKKSIVYGTPTYTHGRRRVHNEAPPLPPPAFLRDGEKERQHIPAPHTPQNKGRTSEKIK